MILIIVVQGKSYILLLFSLFVLMIISKHYSTYTVSLHLYLKPFLFIQIPHKIRFELKLHTRGDEERRKTRKNEKSSSVHPKGPFVVLVRDFNSIC